ncbi:MAG: hypothetical protein Fues2KO_34460 [Fuerstiella sp.]
MRFYRLTAAALVATLISNAPAFGDSTDAESAPKARTSQDVILRLNQLFGDFSHIEGTISEAQAITRHSDGATQTDESHYQIRRSGDMCSVLRKRASSVYWEGEMLDSHNITESVFGEQGIQVNAGVENTDASVEQLEPNRDGEERWAVLGSLDGGPTLPNVRRHIYLGTGKLAAGYLDGDIDVSLVEILQESIVKIKSGDDGSLVITASGERGEWVINLAADTLLPTRIEVIKDEQHLYNGKLIASLAERTDDRDIWPVGKVVRVRQVIDNIVYQNVDSRQLFLQYHSVQRHEFDNDESISFETNTIFQDMVHLADADPESFTLTLPVKNGRRVQVNESPNLRYILNDGKIDVDESPAAAANLEHLTFAPTAGRSKFFLVNLAIGIFALGGVYIYHRRKAQS